MRIVSLLPAATEIVCLLGLREHLVGRSHECDFPPVVNQRLALAALQSGHEHCRRHIEELGRVRRMVLDELAAVADLAEIQIALGAIYLLLRVRTRLPDVRLVERLIAEHRVAVMPGSTFGITDSCSIRLSYGALERHTLAEGVRRLVGGLRSIVENGDPP